MKYWRFLLFPFSVLYGIITSIRNILYNSGLIKSYEIPVHSICVGNLSVGGTGKSPLVIYIAKHLLSKGYNPAIVSRGYGRKSKGIVLVDDEHTSQEVGDELLQYKSRSVSYTHLRAHET